MRERVPYTKHFKTEKMASEWSYNHGVKHNGGKAVATTRMADSGFTPHILRHTCLTRLAQQKDPVVSLEKIQTWAGHKSIIVTRRYVTVESVGLQSIAVGQDSFNSNLIDFDRRSQRTK